jgi:hypothetical protein
MSCCFGWRVGDKTTLYVNSYTTSKLVRLDLGLDGKPKKIVDLKLSGRLMRRIEDNRATPFLEIDLMDG